MPATPNNNAFTAEKNAGWLARGKAFLKQLWHSLQPWNALEENAQGNEMPESIRRGILARRTVVIFCVFVALGWLVCHLAKVQIVDTGYYSRHAKAICQSRYLENAHRGNILDLNGNVFAEDKATRDICAEPKRFADKLDKATEIIARHLQLDYDELYKRFAKSIAHDFTVELADYVPQEFVRENRLSQIKGVTLKPIWGAADFDDAADDQPAERITKPSTLVGFRVLFHPSKLTNQERRVSCDKILTCFDFTKVGLDQDCRKAMERCQEISVKRGVSWDTANAMMKELNAEGIKRGVRFLDSWVRDYPRDYELANLLGFTDNEHKGVSGLEALMDSYLQPILGKSTLLHDRKGRPVEDGRTIEKPAVNGADVYLTIQEPIQRIMEEELEALWEKHHPDRAFAIMIDPATGAVMGLAQFPQFNPNDSTTMEDPAACQNHILQQCYDPGSIMKAISLTGVLASGIANLNTVKDCEHGHWVYNRKALHDSHPMDELTLSEVIKHSSNIGTAKFAIDLGEEKMYQHLVRFGFGKPTGLGFYPEGKTPVVFRNERTGFFRELHQWDSLTISRVPMGQGMTVPLLQMVQAWSALANHGEIMQLYLVDRVRFADGKVEYSLPHVKYRAARPDAVAQMVKALSTVTEPDGTGRNAAIKGFRVAGKTGTAQMWIQANKAKGIVGHYANQFLASFIGFAPAENPRFLLLVSAENPTQGSHTGSGVSAPVFKRIATRTLEYLQVAPDETIVPHKNSKGTAKR